MCFKIKSVFLSITLILLFAFFLGSCGVQKRKYSDGFYVPNRSSAKTHSETKKGDAPQVIPTLKTISNLDEIILLVNAERRVYANVLTTSVSKQISTPVRFEKQVSEQLINQVLKKPIDDKPLPQKKKLELFSKLSLFALLINIGLAISIVVLAMFFTAPQVVIALILLNLFAPFVSLVLALEGKWRVKQHPEKYKRPQLADIVEFASILLIALSLLYLSIMVLVGGVLVAGW